MHTQNTEQTNFAPNTTKNKQHPINPHLVVGYQDFGTACWSYVQGSGSSRRKWDW